MNINQESIERLINQMNALITEIESNEEKHQNLLNEINPEYYKSARNLIHYKTLRSHDIRKLQNKLKYLGLSRLANSSSHVKASLLNTKHILSSLIGGHENAQPKAGLSIKNGQKLQNKFTKELFGTKPKSRRVRIMVTQPTETAENYELVLDMVKNGMNCARINCAHDNPDTWLQIINNVKKASQELGKTVKIAMDLAGPKIRTGEIIPGPKVRKFSPERDDIGNLIKPAFIRLAENVEDHQESEFATIPVDKTWLEHLKIDEKLRFEDTRGKERTLKVISTTANEAIVSCSETAYIATDTILTSKINKSTPVREMSPIEQSLLLKEGDLLTINKTGLGEPAVRDENGKIVKNAHISCQIPEIFEWVKVGEPILFDDGKIEGKIIHVNTDSFVVEVLRVKNFAAKLKAEKGINFPVSDLNISGLTTKDKQDLEFIVKHADIINFSFVNSKKDVEELFEVLQHLNALDKIDIILKIETQSAYDNLMDILLTAMKTKYIGVMIARGDLAVETGWDKIGWVQKEILGICTAAHIPVIWATQVFENLAKKGLPSRAEITDATTSGKADCVMLNKGPYINYAINLLDKILGDMEKYDEKNESMLPSMKKLKA